jgi:hypothetical protein
MKGPRAIELRLAQLERECEIVRARLTEIAQFSLRLRKTWLASSIAAGLRLHRILPKIAAKLAFLGKRTLHELNAERRALKAYVGEHLRAWETKPVGPAPSI